MSIMKRRDRGFDVDLLALLRIFWKNLWLIVFLGTLLGVGTLVCTYCFITPQYVASTTIYVNNTIMTDTLTTISASDLSASAQLATTYKAVIKSDRVLDQVIDKEGLDISASELAERITAIPVDNTEVLKISVTDTDAKRAARIANTIAAVVPDEISDIVDGSSVKIVDQAKIPTVRSAPDYRLNTFLGALVGILLGLVIVIARQVTDVTVHSEDDLEDDLDEFAIPLLGVIPDFASAASVKNYGYRARGNDSEK